MPHDVVEYIFIGKYLFLSKCAIIYLLFIYFFMCVTFTIDIDMLLYQNYYQDLGLLFII